MTTPRDPDEILATWLDEGPSRLPDQTRRAILVGLPSVTQKRRFSDAPWRYFPMSTSFKLAVGALAVFAVILGGVYLLGPRPPDNGVGGGPSPSPSATAAPTRSPSPSAPLPPIDTSTWTTYTSAQYGFSMGYPAGWTETPAIRDWTAVDGPVSPGSDHFLSPAGDLSVSAWSVAVDPGAPYGSWAQLEAWIQDYCEKGGSTPCAGIHERAVPMCLEKRDCHPAMLVPFADDVQAFVVNASPMTIVAVWRPEAHGSTAPFGGSRRLLEAFLSTMDVWPPSGPDNHP